MSGTGEVMTQQQQPRVHAQELTLRCVDPLGVSREVLAQFAFDPSDPYAVWVILPWVDDTHRWAMCRSLLCRGLTDPVGEGDVQLWPSTDKTGSGVVVMDLWSAGVHVVAEVSTRDLYRFLTRTLAVVPFGSEHLHLDVDLMIGDLLSQPE